METTLANNEADQNVTHTCETNGCDTPRNQRTFRPHVDIADRGHEVVVWMDVPGVDEEQVDVTLEKDELTVHARVTPHEPTLEGDRTFGRREYAVGDYVRTFRLGQEVDREKIDASITDGVLRLVLPKAESAVSKKITVKAR